MTHPAPPSWVTQQQAAARYGVDTRTIRNWTHRYRDQLVIRRVHKWTFYRVEELDKVYDKVLASYGANVR